jgi:hypothetical protein
VPTPNHGQVASSNTLEGVSRALRRLLAGLHFLTSSLITAIPDASPSRRINVQKSEVRVLGKDAHIDRCQLITV